MIQTLSSDAFSGYLRPPKHTGVSPLFRAKIKVGDDKLRCYLKPLPDLIDCPVTGAQVANQELINEALGYVLAQACSLAVPDVAGIIMLEAEQIPLPQLEQLHKLSRGVKQQNYFCWFTKDMAFPNLAQRHLGGVQLKALEHRRLKRLLKHLTESDQTPSVIAFDDWLLNSDRHPGNLLAPGGDGLMLIDHGRILNYPNWLPGGVGSMPWPAENRLQSFIDQHEPGWSAKLPKKSAMVMAYNAFIVTFRTEGEAAAREVLTEFFDAIETDAIIQLLQRRPDPMAYAKSTGMVL